MHSDSLQMIDSRAFPIWRWHGVIQSFFSAVVAAALCIVIFKFDLPLWIVPSLIAAVAAEIIIVVVVAPKVRWMRWRYEVRDEEIEMHRGIMIHKRTIVPMVRVQHVDTEQGPLMRKYGVTGVSFSTAAGKHMIPMLDHAEAERLRDRIADLAKVSHEEL